MERRPPVTVVYYYYFFFFLQGLCVFPRQSSLMLRGCTQAVKVSWIFLSKRQQKKLLGISDVKNRVRIRHERSCKRTLMLRIIDLECACLMSSYNTWPTDVRKLTSFPVMAVHTSSLIPLTQPQICSGEFEPVQSYWRLGKWTSFRRCPHCKGYL